MKRIIFYLTGILCAGMFTSCETGFDVNAEWKDITVVYGLLNQLEDTTFIKINKAFLGEGDALVMAQNPDSSSYGVNLEVMMEAWNGGNKLNTFIFDTTMIYNKEPGIFYYPQQMIYKCLTKNLLNEDYTYKLFIKNKITGKVITSETPVVHNFDLKKPNPGQKLVDFSSASSTTVEWRSAQNGKLYQLVIRFHYKEKDPNQTDTSYKYVDMAMGSKKSESLSGGEPMELQYVPNGFFTFLKTSIPVNPNVKRVAGKVDFIFTVASDKLNTYMEVNEPSNSIIQERPEYTNIENGIGIFASRFIKTMTFDLSVSSADYLKTLNLSFN